jgi:heat shock protein HslJ
MKKIIFALLIGCITFLACNSIKVPIAHANSLEGTWELNYLSGPRIAFEGLFPEKKPTIIFELIENRVSGNSSCNNYSGKLNLDGNKINFKTPMAMTRMMCLDSQGETTYMATLDKVDTYAISSDGKKLTFFMGDVELMRFDKK